MGATVGDVPTKTHEKGSLGYYGTVLTSRKAVLTGQRENPTHFTLAMLFYL
ncbi:hypothetical protein PL9631_320006 [Planktothrix paucivesiculata PCC 9631]|uniref:Uncharacterized protein n=1 Tax=Planktothrix paucivesiculata PCC 9631 TaxID=671071 RepID=A0A7Z9DZ74_9CYAN|nr:hypothetical protein PL9631_320006 [Planktothrix paucivesiculata PCC 9631]